MKAIFHGILVLFFLMASVSCYADDGSEFDVRKVRWGMDKDQVIKSELPKKQIGSKNNIIVFNDNIFEFNVLVGYTFKDNALVSVCYIFDNFKNKIDIEALKIKLKLLLKKKYTQIDLFDYSTDNISEKENQILARAKFIADKKAMKFENNRTEVMVYDDDTAKSREIIVIYNEINYGKEKFKEYEINRENKIQEDSNKF